MTDRTARIVMLSLALGAASLTAQAEPSKPSGAGYDIAKKICSNCHLIEPGQANPADHVGGPAFQSVADRPDVSVAMLDDHLRTTKHTRLIPLSMPNPRLTRDQRSQVIGYILSLKQTGKP